MIRGFLILLGCELAGEAIRAPLRLAVPGPVIGMIVLAISLLAFRSHDDQADVMSSPLNTISDRLIGNMGLMFVPAGVGIITEAHLLRTQWLPIMGGLIGSTVLSLVVTGLFMHHAASRMSIPVTSPDAEFMP